MVLVGTLQATSAHSSVFLVSFYFPLNSLDHSCSTKGGLPASKPTEIMPFGWSSGLEQPQVGHKIISHQVIREE
jgi:hypothetical protein